MFPLFQKLNHTKTKIISIHQYESQDFDEFCVMVDGSIVFISGRVCEVLEVAANYIREV